jgi:DNA-directed RNA polymerase I and III subunit RPAC2
LDGEDHTLGNILRYSLIKNPDVEFCGYSITHPSEHTVNLRLQTTGRGTNEVLEAGFETINYMAEVAEQRFQAELDRFRKAAKKASK